jgi:hypothetical protein
MQSSLPLTGKCHLCGDPTLNRFCCQGHGDIYRQRKARGLTGLYRPQTRAPKMQASELPKECPHGRGSFCTKCRADRRRLEFKHNKRLWRYAQ